MLPRRRRHRLRRRRQPVPDHRRRHQPVRVQLATRRSTSGPTATRSSTPSAPRPTPTTCAASSCGSSRSTDGTYTIPSGNLFAPGTAKTRPEIYAMGFRNPFRMSVDKPTGIVYLGDYGPDAGVTDANRGPGGQVEFDRITGARQLRLAVLHRHQHHHARPTTSGTSPTGPTGPKYNCARRARPTTRSATPASATLPAAKPSWIQYGGDAGSPPEFGSGSESPMGGPVYRYDAGAQLGGQVPAVAGRPLLRRRVRPPLDQGRSRSTPTARPGRSPPSRGPARRSWTWPSARTARCTCWTTAPARNNQALYRVEYIGGGNRSPIASRLGEQDLRPEPADGQLLLGRQLRPRGRRADLPVDVRRRHHARRRPTRPRPTPPTAPTPRR